MAANASARYIPKDSPVTPSTDTHKTADRQDSTASLLPHHDAEPSDMNRNMNPGAHPFRPNGAGEREEDRTQNSLPWNATHAPPPLPPPPFNNAPQAYSGYATHPQVHPYYQHWLQWCYQQTYQAGFQGGHQGNHQGNYQHTAQSFGAPYNQPYFGTPMPFDQQRQMAFMNQANYYSTQSLAHAQYPESNVDVQYAFNALYKKLRVKNRRTDRHARASFTPFSNASSGPGKQGQGKQKENPRGPQVQPQPQNKGRYGDAKIMLPAPEPTQEYLSQAAAAPSSVPSSNHILVILDLNGTVLYRPNRNAQTMIARPFLKPFLRYLFENFSVMVWSSAKPDNVKSLVTKALDNDLLSKLVARWGRDSFGLSPANYSQNVQVYKNLKLVWSRDVIQQCHPEYIEGKRFGQHNTVLIDDSAIKASAQPHNLLEIPEFSATPEQMDGDVLSSVVGYLEVLRQQADVSQFIMKEPFKDDGRWSFQWPEGTESGGGEMKTKVTMQEKKPKGKKGKKANKAGASKAGASKASVPVDHEPEGTADVQSEETDITAALEAALQKDW